MAKTSWPKRLMHAWNMFTNFDENQWASQQNQSVHVTSYNYNQLRARTFGAEKSVVSGVTTKIAMDVAMFDIRHVRVDETNRYVSTIKSSLHNCLTVEANKDQTGRAFLQDVVLSMFDEGSVAIVPIESNFNPIQNNGSFEIYSLRTGKIVDWYPDHVRVELYNDLVGDRRQIVLPKRMVAIVENPLYEIMNQPNSTLKRLVAKLILLDTIDNQNGSGKLDLIIQLPYVVKTQARQQQAEARRTAIEDQLANSKYGIAYTDGTERITQLNRPVENTLLNQVEYLTRMFYSQLGVTEDVFLGKASEQAMLNYYDRTVEPIITAIVDELTRKFLSKTARSQGQVIMGFRDVFRLMPATEIANVADTLSRNEIVSPNEMRSVLGFMPNGDPKSDELRNRNMPDYGAMSTDQAAAPEQPTPPDTSEYDKLFEETMSGIESDMERILEEYTNDQTKQ